MSTKRQLTSEEAEAVKEGWFFPENSKRAHYIRDGRSLCRKWGCFSYNALSGKPYIDAYTCKECLRLRQREAQPKHNLKEGIAE